MANVAFIAPHVIQYHAPLYREFHKTSSHNSIVYYLDKHGSVPKMDENFMRVIAWDIDLLEGYNYKFIPNISWRSTKFHFWSRINPGIPLYLLRDKIDIVVIHGYVRFSDYLTIIFAKLFRKKVILKGEATLPNCLIKKIFPTSISEYFKSIPKKIFFKLSDAIMYSCEGNKQYLLHYHAPENKLFPFYCAVDNNYFQNHAEKLINSRFKYRQEDSFLDDEFVIIFLARLTPIKRLKDLILALKIINDNKIKLLVVGDGEQKEELITFAKENYLNTTFVGFKNQSEISRYFVEADCYVIISEKDNSPKSLNEAMNFALPIIATEVIGTAKDLIIEGPEGNGFIVKVGDIHAIIEKIAFLKENKTIRKQMGNKSKEIINNFTFYNNVRTLDSVIDNLIK